MFSILFLLLFLFIEFDILFENFLIAFSFSFLSLQLATLLVARLLKRFKDNKFVQAAFYGLRPASTGLIAAACLSVAVIALTVTDAGNVSGFPAIRWQAVILAVILWLLMNLGSIKALKAPAWLKKIGKLHPVVFLAASAAIGILFHFAS